MYSVFRIICNQGHAWGFLFFSRWTNYFAFSFSIIRNQNYKRPLWADWTDSGQFQDAFFGSTCIVHLSYSAIKEGVSLHSQPKARFREYFVYFLMRQKSKKSTIQKVLRTLILHINYCQKLLIN